MSRLESRWQVTKRTTRKIVVRGTLATLRVVVLVVVAMQLPAVQTWVTQRAAGYLTDELGHPVEVDRVAIRWLDEAALKGVRVHEPDGTLLFGIGSLRVDFDLFKLLGPVIVIDQVTLVAPYGRITTDTTTGTSNFDYFLVRLNELIGPSSPEDPNAKPTRVKVKALEIRNGRFATGIKGAKPTSHPGRIDFQEMDIDSLSLHLDNFYLGEDTLQLRLAHVHAHERHSGFTLDDLSVFFRKTPKSLEALDLHLQFGESSIGDDIIVRYDSIGQLSTAIDQVRLEANLRGVVIATEDLAYLVPSLKDYHDLWTFNGIVVGTLDDILMRNYTLGFGPRHSHLDGDLHITGLPNPDSLFVDAEFRTSDIFAEDLALYAPPAVTDMIARFGHVLFNAKIKGRPSDLLLDGQFRTEAGSFVTEAKVGLDPKGDDHRYDISLEAENLHLGRILQMTSLGPTTFQLKAKGHGIDPQRAKSDVQLDMHYFGLNGKAVKNVYLEGGLEDAVATETLKVDDKSLQIASNGRIDFDPTEQALYLDLDVHWADLRELGFTTDSSTLHTHLVTDLEDFSLEHLTGTLQIDSTALYYHGTPLTMKQLLVSVYDEGNSQRRLELRSDFLETNVYGGFSFDRLGAEFADVIEEYGLMVRNNTQKTRAYYEEKKRLQRGQQFPLEQLNFNGKLLEIDPLLAVFLPQLYLSPKSIFSGRVKSGQAFEANIAFKVDSLKYDSLGVYGNYLEFSSSKLRDSSVALVYLYTEATAVTRNEEAMIRDGFIEFIWDRDHVKFSTGLKDAEAYNGVEMAGDVDFKRDTTRIHFDQFDVRIVDQLWRIQGDNLVRIAGKEVHFDNLRLTNGRQSLQIDGDISEDPEKQAHLQVRNIDLGELLSNEDVGFKGIMSLQVNAQDLYNSPQINASYYTNRIWILRPLTGQTTEVGSLNGKLDYEHKKQLITTQSRLMGKRGQRPPLDISGTISLDSNKTEQLDLDIVLDSLPMSIIEPFTVGNLSRVEGQFHSLIHVGGRLDKPKMRGNLALANAKFHVDYLNTTYSIFTKLRPDAEDPRQPYVPHILLYGDTIQMLNLTQPGTEQFNCLILRDSTYRENDKFKLRDDYGAAHVYGYLLLGANGLTSRLKVNLSNFLVMNQKQKKESLFFGPVRCSGMVEALGPFDNLVVNGKQVKVMDGTRFHIPLEGYSTVSNREYITYVSREEKEAEQVERERQERIAAKRTEINKRKADISGLLMNLNLDVQPEAYFEIIFDSKAGDIIRAQGDGIMEMKIDTRGDFSLLGDFNIHKGSYNFTMMNIVNKRFDIQSGSHIVWNGDPYSGYMEVSAVYEQRTSLNPILDTSVVNTSSPEARTPVPVQVIMDMKGELLAPEIKFDLVIKDYPATLPGKGSAVVSTQTLVSAFINQVRSNEAEMNRQVFSLLLLKKLSPPGEFQGVGSGVGGSLSELFSNQLSSWVSELDEDLTVNVDLESGQLQVSRQFAEGRLVVSNTRSLGGQNNNTGSNTVGEWTIEYKLLDGRLRARAFNRSNQSLTATNIDNGLGQTYGAGLQYSTGFNNLRELLGLKKKEDKTPKKKSKPKEEPKAAEPPKELELEDEK